jgi:ribose transport system substrate-binding protein
MKRSLLLGLLLAAGMAGGASARDVTVAVIPKGTTHEFWKSIHAGAVKAARESEAAGTKVNLIWKGPLREDDREQQIQVVENFIGRKVDGIVLAPLDAQALVQPVETAARAGIPVVIIDSALQSGKIAGFVATDNREGGRRGGELLAQLLEGKGRVLLLRYQEGSASTEEREAGFLEAIAKHPGIEVVSSDQRAGATRDTAYQASQNVLNRFGRKVDGIFTPNESSTAGMTLALRDAGLAGGKLKHVGFDASPPLIAALKAGDIQGLVVQDPFTMGYLGVKTLLDRLAGREVPAKTDTAVQVVTPANLDEPAVRAAIAPPLKEFLGRQ